MIKLFEKVIREKMVGDLVAGDFPLSYLKFSTVTSGAGMNDKVIFLVFKKSAREPFLCVKTVRNYQAKHAIERNFKNLQRLNALTAGSGFDQMFSRAVCLHDDGENVFSIETGRSGEKIGQDKNKLMKVVADHFLFQEYVKKNSSEKSLVNLEDFANETVLRSGLSAEDQSRILAYFSKLPSSRIRLPRIIQHGDLTPDNILITDHSLCVVDYDDVGNTDLPGFDLYSLFRRFSWAEFPELFKEYFPEYIKRVGGEVEGSDYRGLIFLYNFIEYTQKKAHNSEAVSIDRLISGFEGLYPKIS